MDKFEEMLQMHGAPSSMLDDMPMFVANYLLPPTEKDVLYASYTTMEERAELKAFFKNVVFTNELNSESVVTVNEKQFRIELDLKHYETEEITLKVTGDAEITVKGKHGEKPDEHGTSSRQFRRRYLVPKEFDMNRVESTMSTDKILIITVAAVNQKEVVHHKIPIISTGEAHYY